MSFVGRNHPQQVALRGALDTVDDRGTDPEFVAGLERRFGKPFTLDVAAAAHNAQCTEFYTLQWDGLTLPWHGRVWCNPPYSGLSAWLEKAWTEWNTGCPEFIAMLLPANRTEQAWWQDYVEPYRDRETSPLSVEFLRGRMRFIRAGQTSIGPNERPPFGCALLLWERK
jgi:phage N-6-adenine-methyltransferase